MSAIKTIRWLKPNSKGILISDTISILPIFSYSLSEAPLVFERDNSNKRIDENVYIYPT